MTRRRIATVCFATVLLLGSCGAPPLQVYTLGAPPTASNVPPLSKQPVVVAVARVTVPDELDTQDIVVRDGSVLNRSRLGRWASRLSLGVTDRLTQRLARLRPHVLITDRPLTETPSDRLLVNISRLDVTTTGVATLDADWLIVPRDPATSTQRDRAHFTATGPVASDQDVVNLVETLLDRLSGAINTSWR